jgi:hypothetical protein
MGPRGRGRGAAEGKRPPRPGTTPVSGRRGAADTTTQSGASALTAEQHHEIMCSETRHFSSRREDQQLGRTRQRERRGSTGRAGRLKVGTRLAIRLRMDGLLLCRSIGHCGHQPHRYGDILVYIVTEAGDVNPSIMNYIALNYSLEGFSWHFQLYCCGSLCMIWLIFSKIRRTGKCQYQQNYYD